MKKMNNYTNLLIDECPPELQSPEDDNKTSSTTSKKNKEKTALRGAAMSFGFKRRPTSAIITTNDNTKHLTNTDSLDSNGNDNSNKNIRPLTAQPKLNTNQTTRTSSKNKESGGNRQGAINRFGFKQPQVNKMTNNSNTNTSETVKTSFLQNPLRTTTVFLKGSYKFNTNTSSNNQKTTIVDDNRNKTSTGQTGLPSNQVGKFVLQTTQLPQPQSVVRVIESKSTKTLINNNRKLGDFTFKRFIPSDSLKNCTSNEETQIKNHFETNFLSSDKTKNKEENLNENVMDTSLPKLPIFHDVNKTRNVKNEDLPNSKQWKEKFEPKSKKISSYPNNDTNNTSRFLKQGTQITSSLVENNKEKCNTTVINDEQDWCFGGEAMADDEISLSSSLTSDNSKYKNTENIIRPKNFESLPFVKKNFIKNNLPLKSNLKTVTTNSIIESVASNSNSLLLDEETSPVESLLSFSENETLPGQKNNQKTDSDKISPITPNASNSSSLSESKDEFLIDDEIADQPGLIFGDKSQGNSETTLMESTPRARRKKLRNFEGSPLILKAKKNSGSAVSLDTLSPCESIASDDLMMDYEYSQSSEVEDCDKYEKKISHQKDETVKPLRSQTDSQSKEIRNSMKISEINLPGPSKPKFVNSSNAVSSSTLDGKIIGHHNRPVASCSPLRRIPQNSSSTGYDSDDSLIKFDKTTNASLKNEIVTVKTMLLKLRTLLNESEIHNPLGQQLSNSYFEINSDLNSIRNTDVDSEKLELSELRRQLLFLQGQLEDKEKKVETLQNQLTKISVESSTTDLCEIDKENKEKYNAATQTERVRPGLLLNGSTANSPVEAGPGSLISATEYEGETTLKEKNSST